LGVNSVVDGSNVNPYTVKVWATTEVDGYVQSGDVATIECRPYGKPFPPTITATRHWDSDKALVKVTWSPPSPNGRPIKALGIDTSIGYSWSVTTGGEQFVEVEWGQTVEVTASAQDTTNTWGEPRKVTVSAYSQPVINVTRVNNADICEDYPLCLHIRYINFQSPVFCSTQYFLSRKGWTSGVTWTDYGISHYWMLRYSNDTGKVVFTCNGVESTHFYFN
jgi:hypothetical protein